jgi:hypothetical protein
VKGLKGFWKKIPPKARLPIIGAPIGLAIGLYLMNRSSSTSTPAATSLTSQGVAIPAGGPALVHWLTAWKTKWAKPKTKTKTVTKWRNRPAATNRGQAFKRLYELIGSHQRELVRISWLHKRIGMAKKSHNTHWLKDLESELARQNVRLHRGNQNIAKARKKAYGK